VEKLNFSAINYFCNWSNETFFSEHLISQVTTVNYASI